MTHYAEIEKEVRNQEQLEGRDSHSVKLIAVSKTVGPEQVADAIAQGAQDFGENRVEQITWKSQSFPEVNWHFIGNVQSRRIPEIVSCATLIHSIYQPSHLARIDKAAKEIDKIQDILIEVNVSGEESKSGVTPQEAFDLVQKAIAFDHIRVCGLMTMAPQGDVESIDATFSGLESLFLEIKDQLPEAQQASFTELSMGMSEDWQYALPYGATMVRIGRAIFSDSFC